MPKRSWVSIAEAALGEIGARPLGLAAPGAGPRDTTRSPPRALRGSRRLRRSSPRRALALSSTPAFSASRASASRKSSPSRRMTNVKMSPCSPQPKQCHVSRSGVTMNDGVFSRVERAEALVDRSGALECDRFADDVGDRELRLDLGDDARGSSDGAALARSERGCQVLCQDPKGYSTRLSSSVGQFA